MFGGTKIQPKEQKNVEMYRHISVRSQIWDGQSAGVYRQVLRIKLIGPQLRGETVRQEAPHTCCWSVSEALGLPDTSKLEGVSHKSHTSARSTTF